MKFFLVKNQIVRLPGYLMKTKTKLGNQTEYAPGKYYCRHAEFIGKLFPFENIDSEHCKKLQKLVDERFQVMSPDRELSIHKIGLTKLSIGVSKTKTLSNEKWALLGYVSLTGLRSPNFFDILRDLSGGSATVQIELGLFETSRVPVGKILTQEIHVNTISKCLDPNVVFSMDFGELHFREYNAIVEFSVIVNFPDFAPVQQPININQQMLEGEVLTDVTLVASNGTEIKAHKNFLGVQSAVFLAMFQNDMLESRERRVELPDMEEETVRALLKYLYYGDTTTAHQDCMLAFGLFNAGHKYEIRALEDAMRNLLLENKNHWFTGDVGVKLFLFARKLTPVDEELKIKAIQVLKTCTSDFEDSPTYQELFENDKSVAMELCRYAFRN